MYGYDEIIQITPSQILQKISQEKIIEFVLQDALQETYNIRRTYRSPFREDKKAGCRFEIRPDGTILFIDFVEKLLGRPTKTHRSCFNMVMDYYELTIRGACQLICQRFNLSTNYKDYQTTVKNNFDSDKIEEVRLDITFTKRDVIRPDKVFWNQFQIDTKEIIVDRVYPSSSFTLHKYGQKPKLIIPRYICYAIDFLHSVKMYQPYNPQYKWITNCTEDDIGNIDNLPATGDKLIIQKSYKDHKVTRNLIGGNVIWLHNEGCVPSIHILQNLLSRFKSIVIFFDNDIGGRTAAKSLQVILNSIRPNSTTVIYLPRRKKDMEESGKYLKDPGEFIFKEGREDTIKILKQIGL